MWSRTQVAGSDEGIATRACRAARMLAAVVGVFTVIAGIPCVAVGQSGAGGAAETGAVRAGRAVTVQVADELVTRALDRAGANRAEMEKALASAPVEQRPVMRWLVAHMPEGDLKTLDAGFLLEECDGATRTWSQSRWSVPQEIFLDAILPYASVNEKREHWRKDFKERFAGLVKDAKSTSEAAAILNREVFGMVKVKYSTQRKKADQSPSESMESGLASCTGLSVLLIDACRAVGVPARFVGTALWSDRSGNHSWVEIWDDGWHFTGAAEPTGDTLDQGWFTDRAATARGDDPLMGIYAVTWNQSPASFPMVWLPEDTSVRAVDVTERYTSQARGVAEGKARLRMRVTSGGTRAAAKVLVRDLKGAVLFEGMSKDERFDANDHLTAVLPIGEVVRVEVNGAGPVEVKVERDEQLVELTAVKGSR